MGRVRVGVAALGIVLACGGATQSPQLALKNQVTLVLTGPKIDVPFDPKSARLEEATAQLHALVGHPIAFELDAGIFSESRDKFEDMVLGDLEVVASDLSKLKKTAPLAFARGAPLVEHVTLRYDATYDQTNVEARLDATTRSLVITGRGGGWSVTPGIVAAALLKELDEYSTRHFGLAEPDAIPPVERSAYFEFLTDWRKRQKWLAAHPRAQTVPRSPTSPDPELVRKITGLATLEPRNGNSALPLELRKWLFDRLSEFENVYRNDAQLVTALPADNEWRRAETAYIAWISSQVPTTTDDERVLLARNVFYQRDGHTPAHAFPGFDRLGFGLAVIDDWVKAGHPAMSDVEPQERRSLFTAIVCPSGQRCDHAFYRDAIDDDAKLSRFCEALVSRADPKLVETSISAIASLQREDKTTALVAISRKLAKDEALWRVAFRTMSEEATQLSAPVLVDEIRQMWSAQPARRPVLLYALAWADRHSTRTIDWEHFTTSFGTPATAADLAGMLELSPRAIHVVHHVWPALGKGWSRTQALAPFLTAFVDGERAPGEADEAIHGISHALCEEHGAADIKELVAFFDKRRTEHPGERYAKVVTEASTCRR